MKIKLPDDVILIPTNLLIKLTPNQFFVYAYLVASARTSSGKSPPEFPSTEELCRRSRLSKRMLLFTLDALESQHLIESEVDPVTKRVRATKVLLANIEMVLIQPTIKRKRHG